MIRAYIEIENLGPIKQGKLEIKPFTVIVGKNNTGKSYTAMIYYAIFTAFKKLFHG